MAELSTASQGGSMRSEARVAIAGIAFGACVSVAFAPMDAFFLPNFAYFEGSQLAVLACIALFHPRWAVVGGAALSLGLYLAAYATWMRSLPPSEGLAWLGYFFSLPGAAIGALAALVGLARWKGRPAGPAAAVAAAAVAIGIGLNQALVCSTVMYCGR